MGHVVVEHLNVLAEAGGADAENGPFSPDWAAIHLVVASASVGVSVIPPTVLPSILTSVLATIPSRGIVVIHRDRNGYKLRHRLIIAPFISDQVIQAISHPAELGSDIRHPNTALLPGNFVILAMCVTHVICDENIND